MAGMFRRKYKITNDKAKLDELKKRRDESKDEYKTHATKSVERRAHQGMTEEELDKFRDKKKKK